MFFHSSDFNTVRYLPKASSFIDYFVDESSKAIHTKTLGNMDCLKHGHNNADSVQTPTQPAIKKRTLPGVGIAGLSLLLLHHQSEDMKDVTTIP